MRSFLTLLLALVLVAGLTVTDGRARLFALDPSQSVTVYTANGVTQDDRGALLTSRGAYATTTALNTDLAAVLRTLRITERNRYTVGGVLVIEGYSTLLGRALDLGCGRVNCQIALSTDGTVKVGLPILVGAY